MSMEKVRQMQFQKLYPYYVLKAQKKGRTESEVRQVICWLTGFSEEALVSFLKTDQTVEMFFDQAPCYTAKADKITGMICGYRVEEITEPFAKKVRQLDKLIDELAKGKSLLKIFRDE